MNLKFIIYLKSFFLLVVGQRLFCWILKIFTPLGLEHDIKPNSNISFRFIKSTYYSGSQSQGSALGSSSNKIPVLIQNVQENWSNLCFPINYARFSKDLSFFPNFRRFYSRIFLGLRSQGFFWIVLYLLQILVLKLNFENFGIGIEFEKLWDSFADPWSEYLIFCLRRKSLVMVKSHWMLSIALF